MQYLYLFLPFLLALTSCSPLRVIRAEPAEGEADHYYYGSAIASETVGDLTVETQFYDANQEFVIYHVEIENTGDEPLDIFPDEISLLAPTGHEFFAVDAETVLLENDLGEIRRRRTSRVVGAIGVAALAAGTVYAISEAGDSDRASRNTDDDQLARQVQQNNFAVTNLTFAVADLASVVALSQQDLAALPPPDADDFWVNYVLRRTTIRPGEVAVGKLVFDRVLVDGEYLLSIPTPEGVADFRFVQQVYRR